MKIISHAWRSYKSKLVKIWRDQDTSFDKYKDLSKEDWTRFIEKCESENFGSNSQTCSGSNHRTSLATSSATSVMQENRGGGNKRMKDWPSKVMCTRSKLTESRDVSFYSQSTSEVAKRALRESIKDSNHERKNDALSKALQTKEQ
jgi:hypothetical protein